jgi:hypothetical protein
MGVRMMRLGDDTTVVAVAKGAEDDDDDEDANEDANEGTQLTDITEVADEIDAATGQATE